jgi:hypothetical protein
VPSERVFAFWGLLVLAMPLLGFGIRRGGSRVDRWFFGACIPVTFLLLGFFPRMVFDPVLGILITVTFSASLAMVYLATSSSIWAATRLIILLAILDGAALSFIHLSLEWKLGTLMFRGLLLAVAAAVAFPAVLVVRRVAPSTGGNPVSSN